MEAKRLDELVRTARAALANSYAPYSHFRVGAALRTGNGQVFSGTNVENASYGLTICAERVAIYAAVSAGARNIEALAVAVERPPAKPEEAMPCGACRQVLAEFLSPNGWIVVDHVGQFRLEQLLPLAFLLSDNEH
jgi:cytidine deaminase